MSKKVVAEIIAKEDFNLMVSNIEDGNLTLGEFNQYFKANYLLRYLNLWDVDILTKNMETIYNYDGFDDSDSKLNDDFKNPLCLATSSFYTLVINAEGVKKVEDFYWNEVRYCREKFVEMTGLDFVKFIYWDESKLGCIGLNKSKTTLYSVDFKLDDFSLSNFGKANGLLTQSITSLKKYVGKNQHLKISKISVDDFLKSKFK